MTVGDVSSLEATAARPRTSPLRTWLGLTLVAVAWPLCWWLPGLRTHVLFFPLWLGYVLAVDGWTLARTGTSAMSRSGRRFALLFLASAPAWWLFELLNMRLGNWEYVGREHFSDLQYFVLATIAFSTVTPAVLGTAELVRSAPWIERFARGPRCAPTRGRLVVCVVLGLVMLASMLVWPTVCFPFCWTSLVFLLEPLVRACGRRSLFDDLERGDWRPWASLWIAGLICGFFWELWNVWSYPKWIYHVPHVGFAKLFEMPILGYLGYLPFALEVWLLARLTAPRDTQPRL